MKELLNGYPALITLMASIGLSISLGMETLSWTVRSLSNHGTMGYFISRTNIFLYTARMFNLVFVVFVSLLIDTGVKTNSIMTTIGIAFAVAAISHMPLIKSKKTENIISTKVAKLLGLPFVGDKPIYQTSKNIKLRNHTIASSFVFTAGLSIPYILASLMPEYRMTMSNVAQIINSIGTVVLLFYVDPIMYKMMDNGKLNEYVACYVMGRFTGFGIGAIFLLFLAWLNS